MAHVAVGRLITPAHTSLGTLTNGFIYVAEPPVRQRFQHVTQILRNVCEGTQRCAVSAETRSLSRSRRRSSSGDGMPPPTSSSSSSDLHLCNLLLPMLQVSLSMLVEHSFSPLQQRLVWHIARRCSAALEHALQRKPSDAPPLVVPPPAPLSLVPSSVIVCRLTVDIELDGGEGKAMLMSVGEDGEVAGVRASLER